MVILVSTIKLTYYSLDFYYKVNSLKRGTLINLV